jgi:DnaJ-class molecular chaperone
MGQRIHNMGLDVWQLGCGAMTDLPKGFVPPYVMDHYKPCDNCFGLGRYEIDTGKRVICEICNGQGDVKTDPPDDED